MAHRLDPTRWLERLDEACAGALRGEAESVHQVRVATRRLRVWLRFARQRALARELAWLTHELGPLRDLDVLDGLWRDDALRAEAVTRATDALRSKRWRAARKALNDVRPPKARRARRVLAKLERRLGVIAASEVELHRLRRQLRAVRYAREWLELDTEAVKADLAWLGALCDLLMVERWLR